MAEAAGPVAQRIIGIGGRDRAADRRTLCRGSGGDPAVGNGGTSVIGAGIAVRRWPARRVAAMARFGAGAGAGSRGGSRRWVGRCSRYWRLRCSLVPGAGVTTGSRPLYLRSVLEPAVRAFGASHRPAIHANGGVRNRIAGVARGARNNHGVSNHAARIAARGLASRARRCPPFFHWSLRAIAFFQTGWWYLAPWLSPQADRSASGMRNGIACPTRPALSPLHG